jgi:serine/threonine-protein kinase
MESGSLSGSRFGSYRTGRLISRGGMGEVYEAEHSLIGKRAAVKVALPEVSQTASGAARFFNEALAAARMRHRGLAEVYDYGHANGVAFIVMEYVAGETLADRVERSGPLPPSAALRVARGIARAMSVAHAAGVVHRDLKPENIVLASGGPYHGEVKVLDFGIAKLSGPDPLRSAWRTLDGEVLGTPAFMAPEQCQSAGRVDERTDIYALGAVLYFLLTGRPPIDHDDLETVLDAHRAEPVAVPSTFAAAVSPELDALVMRLLARRPQDRPASMPIVHDELVALESQPSGMRFAVRPAAPYGGTDARASQVFAWPGRSVWLGLAGLAAFLLVAGMWPADDHGERSDVPPRPAAKVADPPEPEPVVAPPATAATGEEKAEDRPARAKPRKASKARVVPPRESVKDGALDPFD